MTQELITSVEFKGLRLPYILELADLGVDNIGWKVLQDVIFPNASTAESIIVALTYCRKRNLDIFKRPVHIVPMWSRAANGGKGAMIDTVWPGIAELRTTAFRTQNYAGRDPTVYGPEQTSELGGVQISFPLWGQITVYRLIKGERCSFPGPRVYWLETYAHAKRDSDAPNEMWRKRPFGQLEKCAEGAALRGAFPEEIGGEYAAEEMDGQQLITQSAPEPYAPPLDPPPPETPQQIENEIEAGMRPLPVETVVEGARQMMTGEIKLGDIVTGFDDGNPRKIAENITAGKPKRHRATKAEMEARRAAEAANIHGHSMMQTAEERAKNPGEAALAACIVTPSADDLPPPPPKEYEFDDLESGRLRVGEVKIEYNYDPMADMQETIAASIDIYKACVAAARNSDDLDLAWSEHVYKIQDQIPREVYEELAALDDRRRGEVETL